jgi:hypothetical protein
MLSPSDTLTWRNHPRRRTCTAPRLNRDDSFIARSLGRETMTRPVLDSYHPTSNTCLSEERRQPRTHPGSSENGFKLRRDPDAAAITNIVQGTALDVAAIDFVAPLPGQPVFHLNCRILDVYPHYKYKRIPECLGRLDAPLDEWIAKESYFARIQYPGLFLENPLLVCSRRVPHL